jgi:tellurite resistance protein
MEQTKYSISAVHRMTKKARSTITKHIKEGKLSCTVEDDGKKMIDASELVRVYGDLLELDSDGKLKPIASKNEKLSPATTASAGDHSEKLLDVMKLERERERKQLETTIEHLRSDLEKSQQRESRATQLLEYQTKESDRGSKQMSEIEEKIAKQGAEMEKYKKLLIKERNKTLWQKMFG